MTYVMRGGGGGGERNDDVTKIMPPPKQQVKKSKRPLSAVIEEFEHGNDARANSLLLQPGGIKNGVEEVEEKSFSSSSEKNNNGDISSEGKGGDEASGDRSLSPTVLVPLENGVEGDGGNKDVASSSSSSASSSIVASLKMTSSSSSSTSSSLPTSSRTAQTQSSSATLSLARSTGVPAITVTVAGPEAEGGRGESAGTSMSQLPAMPSALTSPPPPRMNSLFRSSPPSSSPPSPSSPSSLSSTSLSLGRRQALTSPSSFSSSFLLNNLNLQKQQRPPLPSLSLPQRTLMTSRLPVHHEEGSDDGDNNNDNDEDKDSKASSSPDTLSPSATADMARLRQTADRLRLSTRRPSVMQWRARYVVECPRFPLTSSAGSGSADVTGGGEGDVTRGPKNGEGGEEEGGEGEEGGRWTEERKQRIDTAFQWIYNELYEMRAQDQQLARQLLTLRTDLHKLKLARSCEEHQDMLDDVQSELEDLQELADVLDLPTPTMADTPLQHLGVTRWNFTARRFSTC